MAAAIAERITRPCSRKELSFAPKPLQEEIDYLRRNWREEGLPSNWNELPGTGFQNKKQVDLILSEITETDSGESRKEKLSRGLKRTETDIKGFILEYLAEGLVFPIHYRVKWVNGKRRIVDPVYDKLMVDTVSAEERKGSVKRALAQKVEPFLLDAPDGSIAVMTSPAGWTGMVGTDGDLIDYPDSQTYIWQKSGEDFFGFTIRTDFTNAEHRELLKRLSFGATMLSEDNSVCDYVEAIVGIVPVSREIDTVKIVDVMQRVRFDLSGGSTRAYKNRGWGEIDTDLDRREELWRFDEQTKSWVEEFESHVLSRNLSRKEIQEALAVTILRLAKFLRGKQLLQTTPNEVYTRKLYPPDVSYGRVLTHVQELPGCAGGGGKTETLVNSITPRMGVENNLSSECKKIKCGNEECDWEASEAEAERIGKGELTCCPKCGWKPPSRNTYN